MPIISMVGCNAIGKTTAAFRYAAKYKDKLTVCIADNQWVLIDGEKIKERGWKGTSEEKQELVEKYASQGGITLVESARTTHLEFVDHSLSLQLS
jgi:hypothetical protein